MASPSRPLAPGTIVNSRVADSLDRGLPASPEAEASVLGGILLDRELWSSVSAVITPNDFSLDAHRRIYSAMSEVVAAGSIPDIVTLSNQLQKSRNLEAVGGVAYIATLTDGVPRRESLTNYLDIVLDKSKLRQVIHASNRALNVGLDGAVSGDELCSQLTGDLEAIEAQTVDEDDKTFGELAEETYAEMIAAKNSPRNFQGISLCIPDLDRELLGLRAHELLVIGALPERGKTAFAMQIAREAANRGDWTDFYSLEMIDKAVMRRHLATVTGVHPSKTRNPKDLTENDELQLRMAVEQAHHLPIQIHKPKGLTPEKLIAKMRLQIHRHKSHLKETGNTHLVIVDHLKALSYCCKGQDERHRMNAAIELLRRFKVEEGCAMIVLHHLKRSQDINQIPTMQDFKESGDIEAAADAELALFRHENEDGTFSGRDLAILVKMREGDKGPVQVTFDKRRLEYVQDPGARI